MDRAQKQELVADLNEVFTQTGVVVVTHYSGMSVAEMTDLRARMRDAGARFKVTKNRLTRLALDGTDAQPIAGLFTGPTAMGYSDDPVAAPKVLTKYAKENEKLIILGGVIGSQLLDLEGVKALADMPPIEEVRAKLVGVIKSPATKLAGVFPAPARKVVGVLPAPARKLVGVFQAYAQKEAA